MVEPFDHSLDAGLLVVDRASLIEKALPTLNAVVELFLDGCVVSGDHIKIDYNRGWKKNLKKI